MPLSIGDKFGPYEVRGSLGAGGMGEVYRARDSKLNRDVALKVLPLNFASDPDRMARFEREAQVLASLNHPNIAAIYGVEDRAIVMELVEGQTLEERIAGGPIPVEEALAIAKQIADALEYAHEKGVVHRDLKPANAKITPEGVVKVLDFGLAKAAEPTVVPGEPSISPTLTMPPTVAGMIMGTAAYMAPEQARGGVVDKRADVWAFGVVLYEMLTGKKLFQGESISDTLAAVLTKQPDWASLPPETPPGLRALVKRCLEKDRKKRLRDIGDAFLGWDEGQSAVAAAPPESKPKRRWIAWSAAGLLAVIAPTISTIRFREPASEPPLVKLSVTLPEKTSAEGLALSPDGRRLALSLRDGTGKLALWVRSLDSFSMQPLAGTDNAALPFWSPDSRSIGFFAENKLKKIDIAGGPSQIICESGPPRGGTWSRYGVILFAHQDSGILRVSAAGGEPEEITQLDTARQERRHYNPFFLPDHRQFLFTVPGHSPVPAGIWIASIDRPKARRRLLSDTSYAMYDSGRLLFIRNRVLMAQPFDAVRGELKGDAAPLTGVEGLVSVSGNGNLGYLNSFASYRGPASRMDADQNKARLTWIDRGGRTLGVVGASAAYLHVELSPDQTRIATDMQTDRGNWGISIIEPARGSATRLTFNQTNDWLAGWSPDGTEIAFNSDASGSVKPYRKAVSGAGREEQLLQSELSIFATDWSRDGRYLLYRQNDPKTISDLWVLPLTGERKPLPFLQTRFDERDGKFSPDGRWIAYFSDESSRYEVWVQSFPAGMGKWQVSTNGGISPRWRRDGRELYYVSNDGKLMAVEVRPGATFQMGAPQALFDAHGATSFDAASDGGKFLMAIPDERASDQPVQIMLNWPAALKK